MDNDSNISKIRNLAQHPAISKPLNAYSKQEYATPLFVLRETLAGFSRHNVMGLSASLSFYALFALIPMILLIFYLLSHLVFSSDYAIVKLAILTGNIVPELSSKIMVEVYSASQTKAAWGALGLFVLLWAITPLAGAMRRSFYNIASIIEPPSFFKNKLQDVLSVLGILLLFFLYTSAGFVVEKIIRFITTHLPVTQLNILGGGVTLLITTLLIAVFYKMLFPMRIATIHLMIGALLTALLWLLMRPAFGLFLSINQNYGSIFGSMKNAFVSITWLYINFAVFLLGCELIATLRKKDVLLLRGLFDESTNKRNYIDALMLRYGVTLKQGEYVFERGNTERNLYYLVEGQIQLISGKKLLRELNAGEYFGEMAIITQKPTVADAIVSSETARVIIIYAENVDTMLTDEPRVVMQLLRQMAARIENTYS